MKTGIVFAIVAASLAAALAFVVGNELGRHERRTRVQTAAHEASDESAATLPSSASGDPDVLTTAPAYGSDFVKTAVPQQEVVPQDIPVTGKLALDKQKLRIAAARVAGRLGRIFVFEGQAVKAGDALAEIYSPDYVSAENELLLARRFRVALATDADPTLHTDATQTYRAAIDRLAVLGAGPEDIAALERRGAADPWLKVRAPIAGVVIQRNVDPGGYLNLGDPLMTLADLSTLWLYFNLYDADQALVRVGQTLRFETPSLPGEAFTGRVAFIAPSIDPATHTLSVRCDIPNPDRRLKPEMFVDGTLQVGQRTAWVVPRTAVLRVRDQDYLFVQEATRRYRRIAVQGQTLDANRYAILSGLDRARPVVVDGGVLLNQALGH